MTGALRVSRTHFPVTVLGPGTRLGLWVQGCPLACAGCMARDTWDADAGTELGVEAFGRLWRDAIERRAEGLTVSGGEPLAQPGPLADILTEADRVRRETGADTDILLFTGYEPEELDEDQRAAAACADVLVTGRFDAAEPTGLVWRGSANQRMRLLTDLGRRRYTAFVEHVPPQPALQVRADEHGVWIVGVPNHRTLPQLERRLRSQGLELGDVSWRPRRR